MDIIIIIIIIFSCCCSFFLSILSGGGYYYVKSKDINLPLDNKQKDQSINNNTSNLPIISQDSITQGQQSNTSQDLVTQGQISNTSSDPIVQGQIFTTITPILTTTTTPIPTTTSIPILYPFTTHTFTNANATGRLGPTWSAIKSAYSSASWTQNDKYLNMTNDNGIQLWTVPRTGNYKIQAIGAAGINNRNYCKGRDIEITIKLNKDEIIRILVGQMGSKGAYNNQSGGGGGTFVVRGTQSEPNAILVAGGGGGSSESNYNNVKNENSNAAAPNSGYGNDGCEGGGSGGSDGSGGNANSVHSSGGAGLIGDAVGIPNYTSIKSQAKSFKNGGAGAEPVTNRIVGGFGGGGCSNNGASGGGGGGYSGGGGGGGGANFNGGGGGSYSSLPKFIDNGAINSGHGKVVITLM
jgi:hypothetical protein